MKTLLFAMAILCQPFSTLAQSGPKFIYCEIGVTQSYNGTAALAYADFGSKELYASMAKSLVDEKTGKIFKFQSPIDALNFMEKQGWQLLYVYTTQSQSGTDKPVIHHVMKKPLDDIDAESKAIFLKGN